MRRLYLVFTATNADIMEVNLRMKQFKDFRFADPNVLIYASRQDSTD